MIRTNISSNPVYQYNYNFIELFPNEIYLKILNLLNESDLESCSQVCRQWDLIAKEIIFKNDIFDESKWEQYFGKIENSNGKPMPPLPLLISEIFKSTCPIWGPICGPTITVRKTHRLVLIPELVNGEPNTLMKFGKLMKQHLTGSPNGYYKDYEEDVTMDLIINKSVNKPIKNSYWVLMTKDVLPKSKGKDFSIQLSMIAKLANETLVKYHTPLSIEAAICIYATYLISGKRLFNSPEKYTLCKDCFRLGIPGHGLLYQFQNPAMPCIIGNFSQTGLNLRLEREGNPYIGVTALRKFEEDSTL